MRIDGRPFESQDVEATCTLTDLVDDGTLSTLSLDCTRFVFEIDVTSDPHQVLPISTGGSMDLRAWSYQQDKFAITRWLTLHQGGLSLALFDDSEFEPPRGFDFAPLDISVAATDCPAHDAGCECFELDSCEVQDAALRVAFEDQAATVFEGNTASVGPLTSYQVTAGTMQRMHCSGKDCGYNSPSWFVRGLIFRVPEG
jgi:hypothetical protein